MNSVEISKKIEALLAPVLEARDAFCVHIHVHNERRGKLIQIFVDTDSGINIAECAEISRELASKIAAESDLEGTYRLEVSSPGIGQPLKLVRQFQKNIGRKFRIKFQRDKQTTVIRGVLQSVEGETMTFSEENGNSLVLSFAEIIDARVELPW